LTDEFAGMFVRPVWETFVRVADLSGVVRMPDGMRPDLADDALCIGQSMPWIDPLKEAKAWQELTRSGFATEVEVMRKRGVNPRDVLDQLSEFRRDARERGLVLSSDASLDLRMPQADPSEDQPVAPE
jgi:capsid protein